MVTKKNEYVIPFTGLKIGKHVFDFNVDTMFFEMFDFAIVQAGNVKVKFELEKKETMMIGVFSLEGKVNTECDRCTDPVEVNVSGEYRLVYKFDDEESLDESLIIVYPDEIEIDISKSILEFITVSLPSRRLHEEEDCNQDIIALLDEYQLGEISDENEIDSEDDDDPNEDVDPRWDALKKLK